MTQAGVSERRLGSVGDDADRWVREVNDAARRLDERRAVEGEIAEARYWRYVTDEAYKRACEQAWRRLWAERGAA